MIRKPSVVCWLAPLFWCSSSLGAVYVVSPDGSGAFSTIQAAVDAAVDGDIIELTSGTFVGTGNRDIDFLGKAVTIRSQAGDPDACVIDCQGSATEPHRGFRFHSDEGPESVVEGIGIRNGYRPSGGAIGCLSASPTIVGCVFVNNVAEGDGGALRCDGLSYPRIIECLFDGNSGGHGGGAAVCDYADATFEGCTFVNNTAEQGGGLQV